MRKFKVDDILGICELNRVDRQTVDSRDDYIWYEQVEASEICVFIPSYDSSVVVDEGFNEIMGVVRDDGGSW